MSRWRAFAAVVLLAVSGCSAAINAADDKAKVPPLLLGSLRQVYRAHAIQPGQALLTLSIPRLNVVVTVVEGVSAEALQAGAGHYPGTPYPGHRGNVAIFGQRTYYGEPFAPLDQLRVGDVVTLRTPLDMETYDVVPPFGGHGNPWVTSPTDPSVLSQSGPIGAGHFLTLVTSASGGHHLVVRLRQVGKQPL